MINQINADKMYTSEEITDYLNVSLRTTQRLLKSGDLASFKIHGQYRVKGIDALNYLNNVRVDSNIESFDEDVNKPINLINLLEVNPLEVRLSLNLAKLIEENNSKFMDSLKNLREKITLDMGFICPGIKFSDNTNLSENNFSILINGNEIYSESAIDIETLLNKSELVIKKFAHEIISREEVSVIIDKLRNNYPVIVEEILSDEINKDKLNIGQLSKILKSLLKEQVSIRNMRTILESIADTIPFTKNLDEISNKVRESLSRQICKSISKNNIIEVIGLSTELEEYLIQNIITDIDNSKSFKIDPDKSKLFFENLKKASKKSNVILCHWSIRGILKDVIERNFPDIHVISYKEISKECKVQLIDTIDFIDVNQQIKAN